jgi:hypothetical protein
MSASQTLHPATAQPAASGENSPHKKQDARSELIPADTIAALGLLNDEALTKLRAVNLPDEFRSLTEPEIVRGIVAFFSSGEIATQLARISDKAIYDSVWALNTKGALTIATINDFATQFFDPKAVASKGLLIGAIGELVKDLYLNYSSLSELLIKAEKIQSESPKLEPPAFNGSNPVAPCQVLGQSEDSQEWARDEGRELALKPLEDPSIVAYIVHRSHGIDPHAHLLVDSHYVVSRDGLLRPVSATEAPSSSSDRQGDSSITLRFTGESPNGAFPEIPRFVITEVLNPDSSRDDTQAHEPAYDVTYKPAPRKEAVLKHSKWDQERAELCVPEIFLKLVEKFDQLNCSPEEKAQLVAQVLRSQNLIYLRTEQLSKLLDACDPQYRLSLILGLGMGDCSLLSAALQQLLAHAKVNAVIEVGAMCSETGRSYEYPGHARVKVYGSQSILRLDPTTWCVQDIFVNPMDDESLEALIKELQTADAKTCYQIGQRARKAFTTPPAGDQFEVRSSSNKVSRDRYHPERGHRLRDDFEPQTQVALSRILASYDQDLLIAEVWDAYQWVLEACSDQDGTRDREFLTWKLAASLEREVELVGLDQSKILEFLPKMIQNFAGKYHYSSDELSCFISHIESIEVRTTLLARTLDPSTAYYCARALAFNWELAPSSDAAWFLTRLVNMSMLGPYKGCFTIEQNPHFHNRLLLFTARLPAQLRDQIIQAYAHSYGDKVDALLTLLVDEDSPRLYSPLIFPKEVFASIFPRFKDSPVEVVKGILSRFPDQRTGFPFSWVYTQREISALLIVCQYFPQQVHPELKPFITAHIAELLRKRGVKSVDFRGSQAVSALCDLVGVNDKKTGLARQDFWDLDELFGDEYSSENMNPHNYKPVFPFILGYLLKELSALGLVDPHEIADSLYSPGEKDIGKVFDALRLTHMPNWCHGGYKDSSKKHRGVQLAIAIISDSSKKDVEVPHVNLLRKAVDSGLVDRPILDLVRIALSDRTAKLYHDALETAIPDAISYLFSIQDSLRLRSYVRIRTACEVLGAGDLNGFTSNVAEQIKQKLVHESKSLKTKNSDYPDMAHLYWDVDSSFLTLESDLKRDQFDSLYTFNADRRDDMASMKKLWEVIKGARGALVNQDISSDDRERACQIVSSLLNLFLDAPENAPVFSMIKRVARHRWQDEVAKSVRLQRTEGAARMLRKITQSRDNFDSNRNYVTGDDIRAIDWRASGRREQLVVRTYQKSRRSIADSYHILIDLAEIIESPRFGFVDTGTCKFEMSELRVDMKMFAAVADFIHSLAEENRPVRLSVFAFGASVIDTDISTGLERSKDNVHARAHALEALLRHAERYAAMCHSVQCVPDAYSIAGLMNEHERAHFKKQTEPGRLVLQLYGKNSADNPTETVLHELIETGKAARVFLDS